MTGLTRSQLLGRTAKGGAALALGGGLLAVEASPATAAGIGPIDVPVVTLALAGELLGIEFSKQALTAKVFDAAETRQLARAQFNDDQHYEGLAKVLTAAGLAPGRSEDFDFTFPEKGFASRGSAARLGAQLETTFLGIYLGGVASLQDAGTRGLFSRIAASQAQHLGFFAAIAYGKPIGMSFPVALSIEDGSAALDPFIS